MASGQKGLWVVIIQQTSIKDKLSAVPIGVPTTFSFIFGSNGFGRKLATKMASYNGSTEQLEFKGEIDAPKKRLHIVLGLCAFFATLSLIFIILYATAANKTAAPVATKTGKFQHFQNM